MTTASADVGWAVGERLLLVLVCSRRFPVREAPDPGPAGGEVAVGETRPGRAGTVPGVWQPFLLLTPPRPPVCKAGNGAVLRRVTLAHKV